MCVMYIYTGNEYLDPEETLEKMEFLTSYEFHLGIVPKPKFSPNQTICSINSNHHQVPPPTPPPASPPVTCLNPKEDKQKTVTTQTLLVVSSTKESQTTSVVMKDSEAQTVPISPSPSTNSDESDDGMSMYHLMIVYTEYNKYI